MSLEHFDRGYQVKRNGGAEEWNRSRERIQQKRETLHQFLQQPYAPSKGNIIELGCGAGNLLIELSDTDFELHGVDFSGEAIDWARSRAEQREVDITFKQGNVCDLNFLENEQFVWAYDGYVFHCLLEPNRAAFLKETYRILKPGGFFTCRTMCGDVTGTDLEDIYDPETSSICREGSTPRYIAKPDALLSEIREPGFSIVHREVLTDSYSDVLDELVVHARK